MNHQIDLYFRYGSSRFKTPLISINSCSLNVSKIIGISDTKFSLFTSFFGIHDITLRLINKIPTDTVIDTQNNITDDLYAVIEKIKVDDIDITAHINAISRYTNNNGDVVTTNGWLTYNQEFSILVQTPGWYFVRNIDSLKTKNIYDLYHDTRYHSEKKKSIAKIGKSDIV